ncbi:MAG: sensor histidine kinase KdpD [Pseudonocardiales bacterium]|nr:sensor histidine kinase KdpD [Pseudonocardiales bacterium]MBV9031445.1 sensor histidine kinase KdpD [Pseudonocardiales bacterium]
MGATGALRVYLGAAPGVGKTFRMLVEGHRRRDRGADVVIAFVEPHGRPETEALIGDLELIARTRRGYRGTEFTEMDLDAVLARRPKVALVDELAHTNVPGGRHAKRWQDVQELLAAGINVITTVNIQHLESLNDVVAKITGVAQRETVPDEVVRRADQIELVDMTAEALRRRLAHGNVYAPEKIDAALANYFRIGNLTALRELALLWLADRVDEGLRRYRADHGVGGVWETRERVAVALTGGPEGETLIRRAARIAAHAGGSGGDLLAVHVARSDGLTGADPAELATQRRLVESLGGSYHCVVGDDIPTALLDFARAENATQLVLGTSRRGRASRLLGGHGIGDRVTAASGDIDVHLVTHPYASQGQPLPSARTYLPPRRALAALAAAWIVPPAVTAVLTQLRGELNLTSQVLLFLLVVVGIARIGGLTPALLAAVSSSLLLNFYFIPPIHTLTIAEPNNVIALVVFVVVALTVASVVDIAVRHTQRAARASAEALTLSVLAGSVLRGQQAIPALLERSRETFAMASATLLGPVDPDSERTTPDSTASGDPGRWVVLGVAGAPPSRCPAEADVTVAVGGDAVLALRGRVLPAADQRVLTAFGAHVAAALDRDRLAREAAQAKPAMEADRMRTALLAAVSHDLRTPLAAAKAAVSSLRSPDVTWSAQDTAELLATAEESLDRLTRLVENLLDMSRLQTGALSLHLQPVVLDEIIPIALDGLRPGARAVRWHPAPALPPVLADPVLLERVVANLVANALRYSPPRYPPVLTASILADRVELRVIDRGPGIPETDWDRVFAPFQRLGDRDNTTGLGLGLALSRGLVEAMSGALNPEDTPGGGLTMVITLPAHTPSPGHGPLDGASKEISA